MIEHILFTFIITIFIVMVIDTSGLIEWIKRQLYYLKYTRDSIYEYYEIPMIQCAKCVSYWTSVIYLTYHGMDWYTALVVGSVYAITAILLRKSILL